MAKGKSAEAATLRASHLRKQGLQNEALAKKWDRIARKLAKSGS